MYIGIHVKYTLFLSDFNQNLIFKVDFSQNTHYTKFSDNLSSGSHAVLQKFRQTAVTTHSVVVLGNFEKAPKTNHKQLCLPFYF